MIGYINPSNPLTSTDQRKEAADFSLETRVYQLTPLTGLRSERSFLTREGNTGRMLQRLRWDPVLTLRSPSTIYYPDTRNCEPLSLVRRSPDLGEDYQLLVLLAHPLGNSAPPRKESCPAQRFPPRPQQLLPPGGCLRYRWQVLHQELRSNQLHGYASHLVVSLVTPIQPVVLLPSLQRLFNRIHVMMTSLQEVLQPQKRDTLDNPFGQFPQHPSVMGIRHKTPNDVDDPFGVEYSPMKRVPTHYPAPAVMDNSR
jgi:hypothetical protein